MKQSPHHHYCATDEYCILRINSPPLAILFMCIPLTMHPCAVQCKTDGELGEERFAERSFLDPNHEDYLVMSYSEIQVLSFFSIFRLVMFR
jgi:hypothetical protein